MKKVKLTKTELKKQKDNLKRYNRYLPTLYIKKQQLQKEVEAVNNELKAVKKEQKSTRAEIDPWIGLLSYDIDISELIELQEVEIARVNIAGVDTPEFLDAHLKTKDYDLFIYPLWVDSAVDVMGRLIKLEAKRMITERRCQLLMEELRITTQRVNLFEKVKIPETEDAIKRITIYLSDQQAASVCWARIAKKKIQEKAEEGEAA